MGPRPGWLVGAVALMALSVGTPASHEPPTAADGASPSPVARAGPERSASTSPSPDPGPRPIAGGDREGQLGDAPILRLAGQTRVETAVEVAQAVVESATVAVLARADAFPDALAGAPLAGARDAPLLLTHRDTVDAGVARVLERLGVREVLLLGGTAALSPGVEEELARRGTVRRVGGDDRYGTAAAVAREVAVAPERVFVVTGEDFPDALAVGPLAALTGAPVLLVTRDAVPAPTAQALADLSPSEVVIVGGPAVISDQVASGLAAPGRTVRRVAGADRYATGAAVHEESVAAGLDPADAWLATGRDFPDALAAGPAVARARGSLLLVDGFCVPRSGPAVDRLRGELDRVVLLGGPVAVTDRLVPQLQGEECPSELPGGGRSLFPEYRLVAFYGNARSAAMGVLGEQPPDEAAARLAEQAAPYEAGDRPVMHVFELIVTVATSGPGDDGMYRSVSEPHEVQTYLDAARRHGAYLLLDIQPGRSDFLTEVRRYERFLREPDVGVALDPEWRMGPNEVPGRTIGSVDASEVNEVSVYLAGLVAEEDLPEKLFVLHQFRADMITNRDAIVMREGLATTFHIDGFGSRGAKMNTYRNLIPPPTGAYIGFKLFYDEDTDLYQPHEALEIQPVPDLFSYQ